MTTTDSACVQYFGVPRQRGSSHAVFKTPWPGDPRVNIQADKGKAKAYQVRQVLRAITKPVNTAHYTYRVSWSAEDCEWPSGATRAVSLFASHPICIANSPSGLPTVT